MGNIDIEIRLVELPDLHLDALEIQLEFVL